MDTSKIKKLCRRFAIMPRLIKILEIQPSHLEGYRLAEKIAYICQIEGEPKTIEFKFYHQGMIICATFDAMDYLNLSAHGKTESGETQEGQR